MEFIAAKFHARSPNSLSVDDLLDSDGFSRFMICSVAADSNLSVPAGVICVWWTLRGRTRAMCGEALTELDRRSILISDSQRPSEIVTGATGLVLGIVGTAGLWRDLFTSANGVPCKDPLIFPAIHRAQRDACRHIVRAARAEAVPTSPYAYGRTLALADAIAVLQSSFEPLIQRCPGRSVQQKRMVFMRLQRVRNHLIANTHRALNIKSLAFSANYSVWRFIRIYRTVFGETPYAAISRQRIEQAQHLLNAADECIGDVASAVGYESRSALTRALKKRFGINASQLRTSSRRAQRQPSVASVSFSHPIRDRNHRKVQ